MMSAMTVFAWFDLSQHKTNVMHTPSDHYDVVLTKRSVALDKEGHKEFIGFLKDVEFELYNSQDTLIGVYKTNEEGEIWISDLTVGDYYFIETTKPAGHEFDRDEDGKLKNKYEFTVKKDAKNSLIYVDVDNIRIDSSLSIIKSIVNHDGSNISEEQLKEEFKFIVNFGNDPDDKSEYKYSIVGGQELTVVNGETIILKHGQKAVFKNLAYGIKYTVSELVDHDYIVSSSNASGNIFEDVQAHFINSKKNDKLGSLAITKLVENKDGSPITAEQMQKEFVFTINFSDNGEYKANINGGAEFTLKSGETFKLKHGDNLYILGIPFDVEYTIEEDDYSSYHYYSENGIIVGKILSTGDIALHQVKNIYMEEDFPDDRTSELRINKRVRGTSKVDKF